MFLRSFLPVRVLVILVIFGAMLGPGVADAATTCDSSARPITCLIPPVAGSVMVPFDMNAGIYGAGNRGVDFAVVFGDPVMASADGVVVFSGFVATEQFVTVVHPNGWRTTYSYLSQRVVAAGQHIAAGQMLGRTSQRFQLGLKIDGAYADPAPLFGTAKMHAFLVQTLFG